MFGFDALRINVEFRSLLVAGLVVKEVELLGPRLRVTRHADGRYSFSDLLDEWLAKPEAAAEPEVPERSAPPRFSVSNIQIAGGRIDFDDRLLDVSHAVRDLTLRLPFLSSLSFHSATWVEPHFSATVNDAPLLLSGKSRPFAESHESELALDLDDVRLARYFAYSPVALPVQLADGALDGRLRLRFVQPAEAPPTLTLDGTLTLRDFRLTSAAGPLLALKRLDLDFGESDLIGLAIAIERIAIDAPEVDVRIDERGRLNWLALAPHAAPTAGKGKTKAPAEAAAETTGAAGAAPRVRIERVELRDGSVRLLDRSTGTEQRLALLGLRLDASGIDSGGGPLAFALAGRLDGGERLRLDEFAVNDARLDIDGRLLHVGEYAMRGLRAKIGRDRNGALRFFAPPALAASGAGETPAPWKVVVGRLTLADHLVRFEDATHAPVAVQTVLLDSLTASNLSTAPEAETEVAARLRINKRGELRIDGRLRPLQPQGTLQVSLRDIELLPLQAYFGERLNVSVTRGAVSAKGELKLAATKDGPAVAYRGNLLVGDFNAVDKINSAPFLRWKSFHFSQIAAASHPPSLAVGEIALTDFFARAIVSPEGRLNLMELVRADAEAGATAGAVEGADEAAPPAAAAAQEEAGKAQAAKDDAAPIPIRIDKVSLQGGRIAFSDNFVKPNYSANLTRLAGRVTGLSSAEGTVAELELRGSYDDLAPLTVTARLNPLAVRRTLDLDAEVKGIEMTGFTPYSGKYAGYAIDKGKLSLFLQYKLDGNDLRAENRVFLDQLTFGAPVVSPDATTLPVTLAVSLLKNRAGEIDINLPIAGSLDDPEFSIGGVIVKVIVNLFVKAVTSPFALLGSAFGGGEEMAYVEFDPGYAALAAPMQERLRVLAKALEERPALKLEIAGRIDPDTDREGLKQAMLLRRVKAQRLAELVKQGTETGSVDSVEIADKDYPRYLERAYKAEKFPKPRNMVGLTKDLPVEEMEKLMLAN
ncbi:MAG: DUF748 domain-containing protein, partial [Azospira sp.]|nr:DUF748 domain-containing protein [Azospira sp.]